MISVNQVLPVLKIHIYKESTLGNSNAYKLSSKSKLLVKLRNQVQIYGLGLERS